MEAVGLPTPMASWRYYAQESQGMVKTSLEGETVGSENLDPKAVGSYQFPYQRASLPSLAVARSH